MTRLTHNRPRRRGRRSRGVALLVTLILILVMLGMGLLAVYMSTSSVGLSSNLGGRQAAMNAAQAGIQHARLVLTVVANTASASCPTNTTAPWSCLLAGKANALDQLPTATTPTGYGAILYDGTNALSSYGSPSGMSQQFGTYTVYVRNDAAEIATAMASASPNTNLLIDTNNTVVVRSVGRDRSGSAQVVVEAAISRSGTSSTTVGGNSVFGKNIDPYGSNSVTGSFHF